MLDRLIANRLRKSAKSILLLGPRQVGKTTLCRSLKPQKVIDLAREDSFLAYSKDPGRLYRELKTLAAPSLVVLDEIQRVPSLLNTVQAILDEGPRHRFIFTGSSARKLKRGGANLLPGRIIVEYLDPLSYWELGSLFDLEKALQVGTLPVIYLDPQEGPHVLESYANTYLKEEIQAEALTKNLGSYARFLDMAAISSGQWINYSKIASDAEIPKETVRRFYSLLEETLLAFRIPPFMARGSKRRLSQRDRFVFFDIGVRNALLGIHRHTLSPIEKGQLFEEWLLLQCLYFIRAQQKPWKLHSYRTDAGVEVDFIIDMGSSLAAIECKFGKNAIEAEMRGLRSFVEIAKKPVKKFLVYQGESSQSFSKGELAVPWQKFLSDILPSF